VRRSCTSVLLYVGCRNEGENLHRKLAQKTAILACVLTIAFAYEAQAQDQTSTTSLSTASSAQAKPKAKPEAAEAEAGTSEATEALQKATQNPVASLISVPVQNNNNFGMNPGYRNQDVLNIQPVIPIGISKDWNLEQKKMMLEKKLKQMEEQPPQKK
jgi:hypothetical protein